MEQERYLCEYCQQPIAIVKKNRHSKICDFRQKRVKLENLSYYRHNFNEYRHVPSIYNSGIGIHLDYRYVKLKVEKIYVDYVNLLDSSTLMEDTKVLLNIKRGGENRGEFKAS